METELVVRAMETYGGGFLKALANAWRHADANNKHRLEAAFDDYFETYKQYVEKLPGAGV
jgi:hypothetical protein